MLLALTFAVTGLAATAPAEAQNIGPIGPGGVGEETTATSSDTELLFYFDASTLALTDGARVTTWAPRSTFGLDATQTGATSLQPLYRDGASPAAIGGRPVVAFDGADDVLAIVGSGNPANERSATARTLTAVVRTGSDITSRQFIYEEGATVNGLNLRIEGGDLIAGAFDGNDYDSISTPIAANTVYLITFVFDAGRFEIFLDGASAVTGTSSTVTRIGIHLGGNGIGNQSSNARIASGTGGTLDGEDGLSPFDGEIAVVAEWDEALNDARRGIVERALAAAYGLTAGSPPAYPYAATHPEEVAGIGNAGASATHLEAASENLTLAEDAALTSGQYVLLGHDDGANTFVDSGVNASGGRPVLRLDRVWRVNLDGATSKDVTVTFDLAGYQQPGDYRLLRSNLDLATNPAPGQIDVLGSGSASGTFSLSLTLDDGDYLTLGRLGQNASGVTTPSGLSYTPNSLTVTENTTAQSATPTLADDGGGVIAYAITAGGVAGITIDGATGVIDVASTTAVGTYTLTVEASNGAGATTTTYTVTVEAETAPTNLSYAPNTLDVPEGTTGQSLSPSVDDGGALVTFSLDGTPPAGITIDGATGVIDVDGTTTAVGIYNLTVRATNSQGSTTTGFTVNVTTAITGLTYADAPLATSLGADVNLTPTLTLPSATASFAVTSGALPAPLSLDTSTGAITGTVTDVDDAGLYRFTVEATGTGATSGSASTTLVLAVVGPDGPGGVGDGPSATLTDDLASLVLDLDASDLTGFADGDPVATWPDASAFANDATGGDATYNASSETINGRPTLTFASGDEFELASDPTINSPESVGKAIDQRTVTAVFRTGGNVMARQVIYNEGGGGRGLNIYIEDERLYASGWNESDDDGGATTPWDYAFVRSPATLTTGTAYVATFVFDSAASELRLYLDGALVGTDDGGADGIGRLFNHASLRIGDTGGGTQYDDGSGGVITSGASARFRGALAAFTIHNVALNDAQRRLVERSFAVEYDLDLDFDGDDTPEETNGDDAPLYAYETTFPNALAGVGRLDAATQHAQGRTDVLTVTADQGSVADDDFALFGHDGGDADLFISDVFTPSSDDTRPIDARLVRTWRADVQGSATQTFTVAADVSAFSLFDDQEYRLLVDGNADFQAGSTVSYSGTTSGATVTFSNVQIADGDYVTLAKTEATNPAVVSAITYDPDPLDTPDGNTTPVTAEVTAITENGSAVQDYAITGFDLNNSGSITSVTNLVTDLPGFSIDATTGTVTVEGDAADAGTYDLQITAQNSAGNGVIDDALTVNVTVPITALSYPQEQTTSLAAVVPAGTFGPTFTSAPAGATYSYSLAAGTLPTGLTLNGSTGDLEGTVTADPAEAGRYDFTVEATGQDAVAGTATTSVSLFVVGPDGPGGVGDNGVGGLSDAGGSTLIDLDASAVTGLTDGDALATWTDQSANGYDATVPSGFTAPTYRTTTFGGQPALRFGPDDVLSPGGQSGIDNDGPFTSRTLVAAFRTGADVNATQIIAEQGGGARGLNLYIAGGTLVGGAYNDNDDDPTTPWGYAGARTSISANTAYVVVLEYSYVEGRPDPGRIELFVNNGASVDAVTQTTDGNNTPIGRLFDHNELVIGNVDRGSVLDPASGSLPADGQAPFLGDLGRVVQFEPAVNDAQRAALTSALAARYGLTGITDDVYAGDDPSIDFDLDVAALVRDDAPNQHASAESAGVRLSADAGFDDGDRLAFGHDVRFNGLNTIDLGTTNTTVLEGRFQRVWYADATDTGTGLTVDVTFDLSDAGFIASGSISPSGYVLLSRTTNTAGEDWTPVATAASTDADQIRFDGVSLGDGDYFTLGTTDQAASPIDGVRLVLTGRTGNERQANQSNFGGGDAGFYFLAPPVERASGSPFQAQDLVSQSSLGLDDPFLEFGLPVSGMFFVWNEGTPGAGDAGWAFGTPTTELPLGRGALIYVFDDIGSADADPIGDASSPLTLFPDPTESFQTVNTDVSVGTGATGDPALDDAETFHFLGNPYTQPFDLNELRDRANPSNGLANAGFQNVVQIYDPCPSRQLTAPEDCIGAYLTPDSPTAPSDPSGDRGVGLGVIAPWQAFFIERTTTGAGATAFTFQASGRVAGGSRTIVGADAALRAGDTAPARRSAMAPGDSTAHATVASTPSQQIGLRLRGGADVDGTGPGILDDATVLVFHPDARPGWDAYDLTELTPLNYKGYASLGFVGPTRDGSLGLKSFESLPVGSLSGPTTFDLAFTADRVAGPMTLEISRWVNVPDDWQVELVDTQGTADPSDDVVTALTDASVTYTFDPGTASSSASGSLRAGGTRRSLGAKGVAGSRRTGTRRGLPAAAPGARGVTPAQVGPMPLPAALAAKDGSGTPRFRLNVRPGGVIPVELAGFEAASTGERVRLTWRTASETQNAGFAVEHQATEGAPFREIGFVAGAGTTDEPQNYGFTTDALDFGPHRFRLRQVDFDGTPTLSDEVESVVALDVPFLVEAPYPNPTATGRATLEVAVQTEQPVSVTLYDVLGRRVATVHDGPLAPNRRHRLGVSTQGLASGVYFVRVQGEAFFETRRLTVVR